MKKINYKKIIKEFLTTLILFIVLFTIVSYWKTRNHLKSKDKIPLLQSNFLYNIENNEKLTNYIDDDNKIKIYYFFAPWCTICKFTSGALEKIHKNNKDIIVIGIAMSYQSENAVIQYVNNHSMEFPIIGSDKTWTSEFNINAFPTLYFIDKDNKVFLSHSGIITKIGINIRLFIMNLF